MSDLETIRSVVDKKNDELVNAFKKVLEKYSILNVQVTEVQLEKKTSRTRGSTASILQDFNEILKQNKLEDFYTSAFTLVEESREERCSITVKKNGVSFTIHVDCS
ncbi:hypothetical protein H6F75_27455 [Nodosilinea sp. FACHB-131]|uniref:hypothetical protein n=1 Tax=Cyanophyceae TaxID=3028117 RepID=UPI0016834FD4|nr:hypothetical protein [Nodosilinea sp. FACHB-131]MBD1877224.1 hypothetical protein [Nodosilinea sp. FACHB-131]